MTDRPGRAWLSRGFPSAEWLGAFALWLLVLLLLAVLAHAQPTNWQSYQLGPTTYYSGTDANGGQWTGKSYEQWGTRFYAFTGPGGQTQGRCPARGTRSAGRERLGFGRGQMPGPHYGSGTFG